MKNPYEEGSVSWELHEAGEWLTTEKGTEGADRLAIALYRVGAAFVYTLGHMSSQIDHNPAIYDFKDEMRLAASEIADALRPPTVAKAPSATPPPPKGKGAPKRSPRARA